MKSEANRIALDAAMDLTYRGDQLSRGHASALLGYILNALHRSGYQIIERKDFEDLAAEMDNAGGTTDGINCSREMLALLNRDSQ